MAPVAPPGLVVSGEWLICPAVYVRLQAHDNTNCVLFCIPKAGVLLELRVVHLSVPLSRTVELTDRLSGDLIVLNYMSSCITVSFRLFLFALS